MCSSVKWGNNAVYLLWPLGALLSIAPKLLNTMPGGQQDSPEWGEVTYVTEAPRHGVTQELQPPIGSRLFSHFQKTKCSLSQCSSQHEVLSSRRHSPENVTRNDAPKAPDNLPSGSCYDLHFTDGESGAQRAEATCLRSHSWWVTEWRDRNPGLAQELAQ